MSSPTQYVPHGATRLLIAGALLTGAAPLAAQWLDPDRCLTCRDKREHFAAGVALDLLARGPWVARSFHNAAWKRVALTVVVAATWEVVDAGQARREHKAGRPGYGFSPLDVAATGAGAAALELVFVLAHTVHKRPRVLAR